jgi:hypothetical protein
VVRRSWTLCLLVDKSAYRKRHAGTPKVRRERGRRTRTPTRHRQDSAYLPGEDCTAAQSQGNESPRRIPRSKTYSSLHGCVQCNLLLRVNRRVYVACGNAVSIFDAHRPKAGTGGDCAAGGVPGERGRPHGHGAGVEHLRRDADGLIQSRRDNASVESGAWQQGLLLCRQQSSADLLRNLDRFDLRTPWMNTAAHGREPTLCHRRSVVRELERVRHRLAAAALHTQLNIDHVLQENRAQ